MTQPLLRQTGGLRTPAENIAECTMLTRLFLALRAALREAIGRTGGRALAAEFDRRLETHAGEHAWQSLTGLPNLEALSARVPGIDARMLLTVYQDYSAFARQVAGRLLGEQMLRSVIQSACLKLPPDLAETNTRSALFPLV